MPLIDADASDDRNKLIGLNIYSTCNKQRRAVIYWCALRSDEGCTSKLSAKGDRDETMFSSFVSHLKFNRMEDCTLFVGICRDIDPATGWRQNQNAQTHEQMGACRKGVNCSVARLAAGMRHGSDQPVNCGICDCFRSPGKTLCITVNLTAAEMIVKR